MENKRTIIDRPLPVADATKPCATGPEQTITEFKELEAVLKETEEKYKNIFENAMEGIFQTDREGRFTQANPSFARIHGYDSPNEILHSIYCP